LPESGKVAYLHGLVADAVEKGAQVVNPNGGETRASFFYPRCCTR
jgi:glyceraldehyde-3-phosphate dehydrogenase (NADP+)